MYWPHAAVLTYGIAATVTGRLAFRYLRYGFNPMGAAWAMVTFALLVFSVAWGFVAFTDVERARWSVTVTPASTIFPLVACSPAVVVLIGWKK